MSAKSCSAGHSTQKRWWKNTPFFYTKAGQGQYYKEGPAKTHQGKPEQYCSETQSHQWHLANRQAQQQADPQCLMQKGKAWSQLVLQPPHYSPSLFHSNKVKARCTTARVVNGAEEELYRLHQQTEDTRKRNQPRNWHCSYAQFDLEISL